MKKVLILTLTLSLISIVFMILHFFASTDIYHDYIGTYIISNGIIGNVENLPAWTSCEGLWQLLQVDYIIRSIFMILVTTVLIFMIKNYNKKLSGN